MTPFQIYQEDQARIERQDAIATQLRLENDDPQNAILNLECYSKCKAEGGNHSECADKCTSYSVKAQCGMCSNYKAPRIINEIQTWGYCQLRAAADIHPCNLPPWDSHAEQCHFYIEEVAF